MRISDSRYINPVNAPAGWYVEVRGARTEITFGDAYDLATDNARDNGWIASGHDSASFPVTAPDGTMTYSFWFTKRASQTARSTR